MTIEILVEVITSINFMMGIQKDSKIVIVILLDGKYHFTNKVQLDLVINSVEVGIQKLTSQANKANLITMPDEKNHEDGFWAQLTE